MNRWIERKGGRVYGHEYQVDYELLWIMGMGGVDVMTRLQQCYYVIMVPVTWAR